MITNDAGQIQNQYQYSAFGEEIDNNERISNRIRYTDQQYDGATNQLYLRARYYNPQLGRFMQEDPYLGDGLNLYVYCSNNRVMYYDPSGYSLNDYKDLEAVFGKGSIEYWAQGYCSDYRGSRQSRMNQTPAGQYTTNATKKGYWENTRGESIYVSYDYNAKSTAVIMF